MTLDPRLHPYHILTVEELAALKAKGITAFAPGMRLFKSGTLWMTVAIVNADVETGGIQVMCEPGAPPPPKG